VRRERMANELLTQGKMAVSVLFDTVTLEINCGDAYEAQSLFDEIIERLKSGQGLTLGLKQPEPATSPPPPAPRA
jgi:hypothetical protein